MSTRIPKQAAQYIAAAAIEDSSANVAIQKRAVEYADRLYNWAYPEKAREWMKQRPDLAFMGKDFEPDDQWFNVETALQFYDRRGYTHAFKFSMDGKETRLFNSGSRRRWIRLKDGVKLHDEVQAFLDEINGTEEKLRQTRDQLIAMINASRTFEALHKRWPEGEAYYKSWWVQAMKQGTGIAIPVEDINKILGLPKPTPTPVTGKAKPRKKAA
jgi:hypothetical protein